MLETITEIGNTTESRMDHSLQTYLLGAVSFEDMVALQRRLVYEIGGGAAASLVLCEHSPLLTVGRHGSRRHWQFDEADLAHRQWAIRWVNRGGGCWLQLPGQLAIYAFMPLQRLGLSLNEYTAGLGQALLATLAECDVKATMPGGTCDVWAGDRPIACVGVAVRQWVTYYGAILNINPDLTWYRQLRTGKNHPPMTSIERERRGPVRPALVRQRLTEHLAAQFQFAATTHFSHHPLLRRKAPVHAHLAAGRTAAKTAS